MKLSHCCYKNSKGKFCQLPRDTNSDLCFWHNPEASKDGAEVKTELEKIARNGVSLEGFVLRYANLTDIHLEHIAGAQQVNLAHADLNHANLQNAHLFDVNLSHANLLKANLTNANINFANLSGANLLSTKFTNAKIEHIRWGKKLPQEVAARKAKFSGKLKEEKKFYMEAEEIYRNIYREYEEHGLHYEAGIFFQKQMRMKRMRLPLFSFARMASLSADLSSGYGENLIKVIVFSLVIILICAVMYFCFGLKQFNDFIAFNYDYSFKQNFLLFSNCVYFSVVTFTNTGYGDVIPIGFISRLFACIESFSGTFGIALFVVVFVKKMTR